MSLIFKYHSKDTNGLDKNGSIEALDEKEAVKKLQEQGLVVISIDNVVKVEKEIVNRNKGGIPQQNKKKLNTILITIGVLLVSFAILGLKNYLEFKIYYYSVSPLVAEWEDALKIVGSTPRISLSQPVAKLQEIRRKFEKVYVPDKYRECNKYFIWHMDNMISGCLAFMQDNEEEAAKFFSDAGLFGKKAADCLHSVYKLDFLSSVSLLNPSLQANESAAQIALKAISINELVYHSENSTYTTLTQLDESTSGAVSPSSKNDYRFTISDITNETFCATAVPVIPNVTGKRSFCVTEGGAVREQTNGGLIANYSACLKLPITKEEYESHRRVEEGYGRKIPIGY
ncbi:MAG: hypothetical protein PHO70_08365 [Candidatus Omnitrophica bacterium]|nr:hypothetical protein [Candidatus Omnitrophota bacterium]